MKYPLVLLGPALFSAGTEWAQAGVAPSVVLDDAVMPPYPHRTARYRN